jgi:hypothetical protein
MHEEKIKARAVVYGRIQKASYRSPAARLDSMFWTSLRDTFREREVKILI